MTGGARSGGRQVWAQGSGPLPKGSQPTSQPQMEGSTHVRTASRLSTPLRGCQVCQIGVFRSTTALYSVQHFPSGCIMDLVAILRAPSVPGNPHPAPISGSTHVDHLLCKNQIATVFRCSIRRNKYFTACMFSNRRDLAAAVSSFLTFPGPETRSGDQLPGIFRSEFHNRKTLTFVKTDSGGNVSLL